MPNHGSLGLYANETRNISLGMSKIGDLDRLLIEWLRIRKQNVGREARRRLYVVLRQHGTNG